MPSKLGEPIEVPPEEFEPSDEEYRKQTQELLGRPAGNSDGRRKPVQGKSAAAEFDLVRGGKVVKTESGFRLGANPNAVAVALRKLDEPITQPASWTTKMNRLNSVQAGRPAAADRLEFGRFRDG